MSFGPPKTDAGVREVAVPEQVGRLLAHHAAALAKDPDTLLFATATGQPVRCHNRSHAIALARTNVVGAEHLTWHGLRHTGLTLRHRAHRDQTVDRNVSSSRAGQGQRLGVAGVRARAMSWTLPAVANWYHR